jgi:hypothetical protein
MGFSSFLILWFHTSLIFYIRTANNIFCRCFNTTDSRLFALIPLNYIRLNIYFQPFKVTFLEFGPWTGIFHNFYSGIDLLFMIFAQMQQFHIENPFTNNIYFFLNYKQILGNILYQFIFYLLNYYCTFFLGEIHQTACTSIARIRATNLCRM